MAYFKNYPVIHQFLKIHSIKLLSICEVLKTILNSVNTPEKKNRQGLCSHLAYMEERVNKKH